MTFIQPWSVMLFLYLLVDASIFYVAYMFLTYCTLVATSYKFQMLKFTSSATLVTQTSTLRSFRTRSCKPRISRVSSDMSVCPSALISAALTGRIYVRFDGQDVKENLQRKSVFSENRAKISGHVTRSPEFDSYWWQRSV